MDKELKEILQTCASIIDIGADRGTWKGPELAGIGNLRLAIMARLEQWKQDDARDDNEAKGELDNGDDEKG